MNINWSCPNCPQGIKYTVMVSQYDEGKYRETKKDLVATTATFKVPDGKFKITVSASNYPAVTSDYTFVSVSTGGYGWFIFLLLLAIIISVIIKVSKDRRKKNSKKGGTEKATDIFSSGSSISQQASNTKHY